MKQEEIMQTLDKLYSLVLDGIPHVSAPVVELAEKYRAQLDYYAEALTRLTGCEVREKVIWSFHLGREIRL